MEVSSRLNIKVLSKLIVTDKPTRKYDIVMKINALTFLGV